MIEVYINGSLVDLPESDLDFGIDYTIFDVNNIGARAGTRSYSVELPYTDRNKQVFGSNDVLNNLSTLPYSKIPAKIFVDGIDIKIRFCTLKSVKKNFSVEFYGGNSDLFSFVSEKLCNEVDLTEYDAWWNVYTAYYSRLLREGYIYSIIDYHSDSPNAYIDNILHKIRIDFMPPTIFMNTLLNRIISEAGYNFVNEVSDETDEIVISNGSELESSLTINDRYNGVFHITTNKNLTFAQPEAGKYFPFDSVTDIYGGYYVMPNEITIFGGTAVRCIYFQDSITGKLKFNFDIQNDNAAPQLVGFNFLFVDENQNSFNPVTVPLQMFSFFNAPNGLSSYEYEFEITEPIPARNSLVLRFNCNAASSPAVYLLNTSTVTVSEVTAHETINTGFEEYISCASLAPDLKQGEFVKAYLQMFGLLPTINVLTNTVYFNKFSKVRSNIGRAYDWTTKIDLTEDAETTFVMDGYGQKNNFTYKEDGEEIKPIGTDGSIDIDSDNLELSVDVVQLPYAATNHELMLDNNRIDKIGIFEAGEYKYKKVTRVLNLDFKTAADIGISLSYSDGTTNILASDSIPFTYFIKDGALNNLGFDNSLLPTYYELLSNVLNNVKILRLAIRLTASDINQLDFTIPVFLSQYESYFYINKIQGYAPGANESCIVELVKLNL